MLTHRRMYPSMPSWTHNHKSGTLYTVYIVLFGLSPIGVHLYPHLQLYLCIALYMPVCIDAYIYIDMYKYIRTYNYIYMISHIHILLNT